MMGLQTPILLLLFNRPDHTVQIIERISVVQPESLYISIDGPRPNNPTDQQRINQILILLKRIDWPCKIHYLVREQNLGCKKAVSDAITWFFNHVEMGIILEDDCLPDPSFFSYCTDLLVKYASIETVMHIGGANLVIGYWSGDTSYAFTKICHIWGWATWRRAWRHYDLAMSTYPIERDSLIEQVVVDRRSGTYWKAVFDEAYTNRVDTWDYQWVYSIWAARGLCILPKVNLVTNIGFDADATHTKLVTAFANLPSEPIRQLIHPSQVVEDKALSGFLFKELYRPPSALITLLAKVKRGLNLFNRRWS